MSAAGFESHTKSSAASFHLSSRLSKISSSSEKNNASIFKYNGHVIMATMVNAQHAQKEQRKHLSGTKKNSANIFKIKYHF